MTATENQKQESTELVLAGAMSAVQIFTGGGLDSLLDGVEAKVRAIETDVSTEVGRAKVRSLAYQVTRTKTTIDAEGKKLTEDWRLATKKVNEERRRSEERLDALAEEVRQPLTDFENRDKIRVAAHESALKELSGLLPMLQVAGSLENAPASLLEKALVDYAELSKDRDWEEFSARATQVRRETNTALIGKIQTRKQFEADQAELERLRQEEAARKQRERDERLKAEAAESARLEAEQKAKAEADEKERIAAEDARLQRLEAERRINEQRERAEAAEAERVEAEHRVSSAEEARVASEKRVAAEKLASEAKAASDAKAAKDKAKRDQDAAVQRERDRAEKARAEEERQRLAREADEANKARVRGEILEDLLDYFLLDYITNEAFAGKVADVIMAGQIRNVKVTF